MRPARLCVFPLPLNPKARGTPGRITLVGEAQILRANPNAPPAGRSTDRTFASNIRWECFVSPELERSPPHRGGGRAGQRPCDQSISGRRDPAGTLRVRGEAVCASFQGMPFEPCFHLEKTDDRSFRGSWIGSPIATSP